MSLFRSLAVLAVAAVLLIPASSVQAVTAEELRAQIAALMAQLASLEGGSQNEDGGGSSSCLSITHTLALGSTDATTGGDVSRLQRFLGGEVTGYYGVNTMKLVSAWQTAHGIAPVGAVGPITRAAMMASCDDGDPSAMDAAVEVVSVSSSTIEAIYRWLPVGSQIWIVDAAKREKYLGQSTMVREGGSGSASIPVPSDLPAGSYRLQAANYRDQEEVYAESAAFSVGRTSAAEATIDQSSLRHDEHIDLRITGTAKNTTNMLYVFVVPAGDFGVSHGDFAGMYNQLGKDGFFMEKAAVRTNGSWAAEFEDAYIPEGTSRVLVYEGATKVLLARAPLVIDTAEATEAEAEEAIDDAEDTIDEALEAYARATSGGAVSATARDAKEDIDEAEDELAEAKDAFDDGDYAGAYDSAISAKGWAESALERLGENDEGPTPVNNTRLEVTVPAVVAVGSTYTVSWDEKYGPSIEELLHTFPDATGDLIAHNKDRSLGVSQFIDERLTGRELLAGKASWTVGTRTNDGRAMPSGTYYAEMAIMVPDGRAIASGSSKDFSVSATTTTRAPWVSVSVSPATITAGQTTTLSWSSTNAQYCSMGDKLATSGSMQLAPEVTKTYTIRCVNGSLSAEGSATVTVRSVAAATDSFSASPLSGNAPLTVSFSGQANTAKSCSGGYRTLAFGDGETYQIAFPSDVCRASSWSVSHTFAKPGSYAATLYSGAAPKGTALMTTQIKVVAAETPRPPVTPAPSLPGYKLNEDGTYIQTSQLEASAYAALASALEALKAQLAALSR